MGHAGLVLWREEPVARSQKQSTGTRPTPGYDPWASTSTPGLEWTQYHVVKRCRFTPASHRHCPDSGVTGPALPFQLSGISSLCLRSSLSRALSAECSGIWAGRNDRLTRVWGHTRGEGPDVPRSPTKHGHQPALLTPPSGSVKAAQPQRVPHLWILLDSGPL